MAMVRWLFCEHGLDRATHQDAHGMVRYVCADQRCVCADRGALGCTLARRRVPVAPLVLLDGKTLLLGIHALLHDASALRLKMSLYRQPKGDYTVS